MTSSKPRTAHVILGHFYFLQAGRCTGAAFAPRFEQALKRLSVNYSVLDEAHMMGDDLEVERMRQIAGIDTNGG